MLTEPMGKPVPAKRKRPNDLRQSSLPETSDFRDTTFHYANKDHCFTDTALNNLHSIVGKDSSESPEFENAATPFHETELRISDDFDNSQEDEVLSPSFTTVQNTFGVNSVVDVVSGFENDCDHREMNTLNDLVPITSAEFTSEQQDIVTGTVAGATGGIAQCGFTTSVKNSSGSRSDDSALPSSADNSDGSNAMGLDLVMEKCSENVLNENLDLSDSGEVLHSHTGLDNPKSRRPYGFNYSLNLLSPDLGPPSVSVGNKDITLNLPDAEDDCVNTVPPDLPPRTYKAPPLPPRNRLTDAPPLPPRNTENKHGSSMQTSTHTVTTPTSPARSVESLDFVNLAPLEPPPLPPRTYSPVHMTEKVDRGADSGSGGSMSLLSTEDSDSRSFDSMEAFSGSRESLQNDSSDRDRRSSGLSQDVIKREHKKLHRLSQGKSVNRLSGGIPAHGVSLGAEAVETQRPVTPPTREWRRSAEILPLDQTNISTTPPPIVHRHKPVDSSQKDKFNVLDPNSGLERLRAESFDSPVERLRSLNFAPVNDPTTSVSMDRLRRDNDTPPPVERNKVSEPLSHSENRSALIDSHNTHRPLNLTHSVGRHRHKDPQTSIMDRSGTFDLPPPFNRQRSVDSIPVERLRNIEALSNTQFNFEMPASLPPFLTQQSIDQPLTDTVITTTADSGQLVNSEGQNIYSPVLELQPPIYSRQRSRDPPRPVDRQQSSDSQASTGSVFQTTVPTSKPPVRRSLSPAVRRALDSTVSEAQGAVGGSPALPVRTYPGIESVRPETPPRPGALGSGRDNTPSPPIIRPRGRVMSDEERRQNKQNIHQHLQMWTQSQKDRANSSFGSENAELDLASPTSETRSLTNGHCGWVTFDDHHTTQSQTVNADSSQSELQPSGAEGRAPAMGQSAISNNRASPTPSSSVIWQLRHAGEQNDPPPSIDSGKIFHAHIIFILKNEESLRGGNLYTIWPSPRSILFYVISYCSLFK